MLTLSLPRPVSPAPSEARQHPRLPVAMPVQLRLPRSEKWFAGHSANVSAGGIFIATEVQPLIGSEVAFEISQGPDVVLRGTGTVRWLQLETKGGLPRGFGLQFDLIDEAVRTRILTLVQERLAAG